MVRGFDKTRWYILLGDPQRAALEMFTKYCGGNDGSRPAANSQNRIAVLDVKHVSTWYDVLLPAEAEETDSESPCFCRDDPLFRCRTCFGMGLDSVLWTPDVRIIKPTRTEKHLFVGRGASAFTSLEESEQIPGAAKRPKVSVIGVSRVKRPFTDADDPLWKACEDAIRIKMRAVLNKAISEQHEYLVLCSIYDSPLAIWSQTRLLAHHWMEILHEVDFLHRFRAVCFAVDSIDFLDFQRAVEEYLSAHGTKWEPG